MVRRNTPVTRAQVKAFMEGPRHAATIGGLNGGVPNRKERRGGDKRSSTKVPLGSPYRLTYIKDMSVDKAIDEYGRLVFKKSSPKVKEVTRKIKVVKSIREMKQSTNANRGNVEVS
jgi:hypothetical protein